MKPLILLLSLLMLALAACSSPQQPKQETTSPVQPSVQPPIQPTAAALPTPAPTPQGTSPVFSTPLPTATIPPASQTEIQSTVPPSPDQAKTENPTPTTEDQAVTPEETALPPTATPKDTPSPQSSTPPSSFEGDLGENPFAPQGDEQKYKLFAAARNYEGGDQFTIDADADANEFSLEPFYRAIDVSAPELIQIPDQFLEMDPPFLQFRQAIAGKINDRIKPKNEEREFPEWLDQGTCSINYYSKPPLEEHLKSNPLATLYGKGDCERDLVEKYAYNDYNYRTPRVFRKLANEDEELPIIQITAWHKTNFASAEEGQTSYAVTFFLEFKKCGENEYQPSHISDLSVKIFERPNEGYNPEPTPETINTDNIREMMKQSLCKS